MRAVFVVALLALAGCHGTYDPGAAGYVMQSTANGWNAGYQSFAQPVQPIPVPVRCLQTGPLIRCY